MSVADIKHYIRSIFSMRDGNKSEAEAELAQSLHVNELPPYAKENLHQLLDPENPNDAVLTIIQKENTDGR